MDKTFTFIYASKFGANVKHYFKDEAVKIAGRYISESRMEEAAKFFLESEPGDEFPLNNEILIFRNSSKSTLTPRSFKSATFPISFN
jgi:hypothetical protein